MSPLGRMKMIESLFICAINQIWITHALLQQFPFHLNYGVTILAASKSMISFWPPSTFSDTVTKYDGFLEEICMKD